MEHLGLSVSRLIRVTYGPFQLGDIEPGQVEAVKRRVLREQLGLIGGDDSGHAKAQPKRVAGTAPPRRQPAGGRPAAGKNRTRGVAVPMGSGRVDFGWYRFLKITKKVFYQTIY